MITVAPGIHVPAGEIEIRYVRSSGPGGQNVNKTSTKAVVRWNIRSAAGVRDDVKARFLESFGSRVTTDGDILLTSDRFRDQPRNLEDCLTKLHDLLAQVAVAPTKRRATKPGRGAKERRIQTKKTRGAVKSLRGRVHGD